MSDLRDRARRALGGVSAARRGTVAEAMHAGAGPRPLLTLGALDGVVLAQGVVLLALPDVARSLGRSQPLTAFVLGLWVVGVVLAAPFGIRAALKGAHRTTTAALGTALVATGLLGVALAPSPGRVAIAAPVAGAGSVLVAAVRRPLLADLFPPAARARAHAVSRAAALVVVAVATTAVHVAAPAGGFTWRAGVLVISVVTAAVAVATVRMHDPGSGVLDEQAVQWVVHGDLGRGGGGRRTPTIPEAVRRVTSTPTVRPALFGFALTGALVTAVARFGGYLLAEHGGAAEQVVAAVLAGGALLAATAVVAAGPAIETAFAVLVRLPRQLAAPAWVAAVGLAVSGFLPLPGAAAALAAAGAGLALVVVALDQLLTSSLSPALRGTGATLAAVAAVAGWLGGGPLLASVDGAAGLPATMVCAGAAAAAAGLALRAGGRHAARDLDRIVDELVEREELVRLQRSGTPVPLLSCRRVSFSYGPLQVLFDVDFAVDEGEMVALLGTNGAGKSTLLKVVSGVGLPSSGTVRLRGADITFAEPGERVRAGITQIPGGKAVFGPLSVVENLRLYGYALGRNRAAVDRGIEEAFVTFPRLAERRNAAAQTMSGGEQQMLALTKAFILRPQLLLIDELSLGLAPKVVGELLGMVRQINATGTAVVLVEQSVNVALSLAEHAYFMEKGAVRFDGATAELLERPEILRSVFLEGAAKGLAG